MKKINLADHDIFTGNDWKVFDDFLETMSFSKVIILVDENTRRHCLPMLLSNTSVENPELIEIPSGEKHKTIDTCKLAWQRMLDRQIDRKALLINLGGGVIGDLGGFCAATFKRGIDFIQMPTTLLAQVDASIGGKLGVDFGGVKNSIGLFKNPKAVFINPDFLQTLPEREIRSGFAEIIKHSLIADAGLWEQIETMKSLGNANWQDFIIPSLLIKKQIVGADPFEQNIRKKLNFGHTIGHAIECLSLQSEAPRLHGEAIAAGMICEAWLSAKYVGLSKAGLNEIEKHILKIYGKMSLDESAFPRLLELMKNDKKNLKGAISFTLLTKPGAALTDQFCSEKLILESLGYYSGL